MKDLSLNGISTLVRPAYSPGLLLEDEDLTAAVDYTRNLTRLLFRSLFGCGVICGLEVKAEPSCNNRKIAIKIDRGLGLDCSGNPIEVPKDVSLEFDPECEPFPPHIWVVACHTSQSCRSRDVACCPDEDDPKQFKTRLQDGYRIELRMDKDPPDDVCRCGGHKVDDCGCGCDCHCSDCILIGKIVLGKAEDGVTLKVTTDDSQVRKIRPALQTPCPPETKKVNTTSNNSGETGPREPG
ncbi:hypothetical protein [Bradyrhizobium sp. USDA 3315]